MPAVSAIKPAIKAKFYRNTGNYGTPVWVAIDYIRDANVGKGWDFTDASIRGTRVKLYAPTQVDFALTATARCDDLDAGYLALDALTVNGATADFLVLDGALTVEGTRGVRADFHVSDAGQDQSIGNVLYKQFELKPGVSANFPMAIVVGASSAITMTAPG
jgi:hypothetical protein